MKKFFKRGIVCFLAATMVAQSVFTINATTVYAAHKETAVLNSFLAYKYLPNGQCCVKDTSLPAPFNQKEICGFSLATIVEEGDVYDQSAYCINIMKDAHKGDKLSSKPADTSDLLTDEEATLVNLAILKGFAPYDRRQRSNYGYGPNNAPPEISNNNVNISYYYPTQVLVWIITEGYFYDDAARTKIENFFFKLFPDIKAQYQEIYNEVAKLSKKPSFLTNDTQYLNYNTSTGKYELTLTNTTTDGLLKGEFDKNSLPEYMTATVNDNTVTITSDRAITEPVTLKLKKNFDMDGELVPWESNGGSAQPLATLDYDGKCKPFVFDIKVAAKEVPPTQAPTVTPEATTPPNEPKIEGTQPEIVPTTPPVEKQIDPTPKTADSMNNLPFILLGASLVTMLSLYGYKRYKRERF